jgi:hypothetical protein
MIILPGKFIHLRTYYQYILYFVRQLVVWYTQRNIYTACYRLDGDRLCVRMKAVQLLELEIPRLLVLDLSSKRSIVLILITSHKSWVRGSTTGMEKSSAAYSTQIATSWK